MGDIETGKKSAAHNAIDSIDWNVINNVGIGSGSTIVYAVERLAEKLIDLKKTVICVPTSYQAKQMIRKLSDKGLVLSDLDDTPELDVTIDGADEVDSDLNVIKGGGGCLTQEKIVASASAQLIIVADYTKKSKRLGDNWKKGIPIEVIPMAQELVKRKIIEKYGGEPVLREAKAKMGPLVTDNSNFIIDWKFKDVLDWNEVNMNLKMIAGVVETGLFVKMANVVYFPNETLKSSQN